MPLPIIALLVFLCFGVATSFQSATPSARHSALKEVGSLTVPAPPSDQSIDSCRLGAPTSPCFPVPQHNNQGSGRLLGCGTQNKDFVADNGVLESSAVVVKSRKQQPSWRRLPQRWSRRLNTCEDARWVHKISSLSWLLSSINIASVGALNGFTSMPNSLETSIWVSLVCTVFLGVNGSQMAMKYRSKDSNVRNGMINMALAQIALAIAVVYQGPFCPDWLDSFFVGNGAMLIPLVPGLIMTLEDALSLKDKLGERNLRLNEPSSMDFGEAGDAITGISVVCLPLLMTAYAVPMLMDPAHDRTWFLNEILSGSSEAQAANVYSCVFFNLSAGLGSVAITLRDRKLITKWAEQVLSLSFMAPAFVLAFQAFFLLK